MTILIFFIILAVLILSHELGHFLAAKGAGVRVDEFGIGFPPRLFGVKKGETTYSVNAIPFGGFVKIWGETPDSESMIGADSARSLVNKPRYVQAWVLFAGVFFNVILAWLLLVLGLTIGLPAAQSMAPEGYKVINEQLLITNVQPGTPADIAGLKAGSVVSYVTDGKTKINEPSVLELESFIQSRPDISLTFGIIEQLDGDKKTEISVTPQTGLINGKPGIGIGMDEAGILKLPFWVSLTEGLKLTANLTINTFLAFADLISRSFQGESVLDAVTGPVGLVGVVRTSASLGFTYLLSLVALISINLAIVNLLPIPALDGGRLLVLGIEAVRRRPIKAELINAVNSVGFVLLLLLMAVITYRDVIKLVTSN